MLDLGNPDDQGAPLENTHPYPLACTSALFVLRTFAVRDSVDACAHSTRSTAHRSALKGRFLGATRLQPAGSAGHGSSGPVLPPLPYPPHRPISPEPLLALTPNPGCLAQTPRPGEGPRSARRPVVRRVMIWGMAHLRTTGCRAGTPFPPTSALPVLATGQPLAGKDWRVSSRIGGGEGAMPTARGGGRRCGASRRGPTTLGG